MQPQGHTQLLMNMLVFGMEVQEAIDAPRFRHLEGVQVALESGVDTGTRAQLSDMGHEVIREVDAGFGGAQAILRLPQGWAAGSDGRKDGMAVGR